MQTRMSRTLDAPAPPDPAQAKGLHLCLGWLWALVLAVMGIFIWSRRDLWLAIVPQSGPLILATAWLCLAGGQFVFLLLVADRICPRTPQGFALFLKTFFGAQAWMCLGWLLWASWGLLTS